MFGVRNAELQEYVGEINTESERLQEMVSASQAWNRHVHFGHEVQYFLVT